MTDETSVDEFKPEDSADSHSPAPEIAPERLDEDGVYVIRKLKQSGHEAYFVGGCVRDWLIGRQPKDFDIATSATPNQVRGLFRNCRLIGRRFRLAHIYFRNGKILEVSTFRAPPPDDEGGVKMVEEEVPLTTEEGDGGQLSFLDESGETTSVEPATTPAEQDLLIVEDNTFGTAVEDARRRDFTINGLFYDPAQGVVIDHVNGLADLAHQEIRTIGDPEKRLREDPVRILRAVRFAAKLGFEIEPSTYAAMEGAVEDLPRCSPPRLLEETFRLLRGGSATPALRLIRALNGLGFLLAPVDDYLRQPEKVERYFSFINALDELVLRGQEFDDAMLLAAVLLPLAIEDFESWRAGPELQPGDDDKRNMSQSVEGLLRTLVQTARLPRRMAERCRMILLNQRTLVGWRRRRGGLQGLRRHPLFAESLRILEVWVGATQEHQAALEAWKSGGAPAPAANAPGPTRKRRRGRGGKALSSNKGEAVSAAAEHQSADGSAEAV
jgi:poly(A) polymerase